MIQYLNGISRMRYHQGMAAGLTEPSDDAVSGDRSPVSLRATSLAGEPSFLLARANARSVSLGNAALQPLGLKVRSYSILAAASSPARPSQRDLATFLRMDPSQVVAVVDELEAMHLVTRVPDPHDRRANAVVATEAGARVAREAREALARVDQDVFAGFSPQELTVLHDYLGRVAFGTSAEPNLNSD